MGVALQAVGWLDRILTMTTFQNRGGVEIPVEQFDDSLERLREQQRYVQIKRYQRDTPVDPTWPRRKKSDLMSHMVPQYKMPGHKRVTQERSPEMVRQEQQVEVKIQRQGKKEMGKKDQMWPRRKKSDLLIYQQTRNL